MKYKNKFKYVLPIIGLIILDQLLKIFVPKDIDIITGVLKFSNVENTGGAFGIMESNTILMIIFNIIVLLSIGKLLILHEERMAICSKVGIVLVFAGGISNLIDRLFRGYVVDYIDITQLVKFPVFNFADIMLTIGWICFAIGIFGYIIKNKGDIHAI